MRTVVAAAALLAVSLGLALVHCGAADESVDVDVEDGGGGLPPDAASVVDTGVDAGGDGAPTDAASLDASPALVSTCNDAGTLPGVWLADPRLCLSVFAPDLAVARQLAFAPNGDLFVQAAGKVIALFDQNGDGTIGPGESSTFASSVLGTTELNHGLAFSTDGAFVYASNESTIFRWPYTLGSHAATAPAEVVVHDMPSAGHTSRTLVFDAQGRLYVNVGSATDLDQLPQDLALRSMVRRFTVPAALPVGGLAYASGEVFASGLRNEVGLTFDSKGRMWGVENGSDGVSLPAFGDLTADNPAEEINRLDGPGARFYGYPLCWSEFGFDGGAGPGKQWAYPGGQTDAWCRDVLNVHPPAFAMRGHWASLGITEYAGDSLPWKGDLLIASHGSSFRNPAVGRLIAHARVVGDQVVSVTPIVGHGVDGGLEQGTWDARPVDIRTGKDGAVYFSDDKGHRVFRLGYRP